MVLLILLFQSVPLVQLRRLHPLGRLVRRSQLRPSVRLDQLARLVLLHL